MWKAIVAGAAALAIAGTSAVYAQNRLWRPDDASARWRPSLEDLRALGEARLAALKAGLVLTAEQERNWPAFEEAARELGKLRLDRIGAMRSASPSSDPVERMRRRAAAMSDTGAALKRLADATDPLYQSLDESQKRRFALLSRMAGHRMGGHGHHFRGVPYGDDLHHFGPGRMDGGDRLDRPEEHRL